MGTKLAALFFVMFLVGLLLWGAFQLGKISFCAYATHTSFWETGYSGGQCYRVERTTTAIPLAPSK